jgi:LysR family cys regulon transcriptional activator
MTLTQLRYLVAIVDAGLNITLAAERVHATQPGLSKQLKQLEDELGFQLFTRRGRSLDALTPAGGEVLARARRILAETANIRTFAANQRGEISGELTIVTTHTQARFVLPPAIAAVRRAYPAVSVRIEPAGDAEVQERLLRGETDLAVISTAGPAPEGGLAIPLFRWQRRVLVPHGHRLAALTRAPTLAEVAAEPLVSYESSLRADSSLRRAFAAAGLEPRLAMTARDADLIKAYVRAGLGVGLLAEMALLPEDTADFVALPVPSGIPGCTSWAVLSPARVLRDYAADLLLALAPWLDRRDLRRVLAGTQEPVWPMPPAWPLAPAAAGPVDR